MKRLVSHSLFLLMPEESHRVSSDHSQDSALTRVVLYANHDIVFDRSQLGRGARLRVRRRYADTSRSLTPPRAHGSPRVGCVLGYRSAPSDTPATVGSRGRWPSR